MSDASEIVGRLSQAIIAVTDYHKANPNRYDAIKRKRALTVLYMTRAWWHDRIHGATYEWETIKRGTDFRCIPLGAVIGKYQQGHRFDLCSLTSVKQFIEMHVGKKRCHRSTLTEEHAEIIKDVLFLKEFGITREAADAAVDEDLNAAISKLSDRFGLTKLTDLVPPMPRLPNIFNGGCTAENNEELAELRRKAEIFDEMHTPRGFKADSIIVNDPDFSGSPVKVETSKVTF